MAMPSLDQFRAFLDHFDADDRDEVLMFFRFVGVLEEDALDELGTRLQKSMASRGLRRVVLETAFYYPWVGWLEYLSKLLRHETDQELFEAGARVIGRIRDGGAMRLLRELHTIRQAEAFQAILGHVLAESDPREAFSYHLGRLLEGSASPRVANEAAAELVRVVSREDLPRLLVTVQHPDLLVARHALRLVTHVHAPESAEFLLEQLRESHQETLADRQMKEYLGVFRGAPLPVRGDVIGLLRTTFGLRCPEALTNLESEPDEFGAAGAAGLEALRCAVQGGAETFLVEAAAMVLEGKPAKLAALAAEASEGVAQRGRRLGFTVDTCAEGLGSMVRHHILTVDQVLPSVVEAYTEATGREGLARVLGQLVSPKDQGTLGRIMAGPDPASRGAALEAIGVRQDEDMLPFLLAACQDPIVDLAQRAMVALGQLGGAPGTVMRLVLSGAPDEARLGIRIAGINRMEGAASVLLEFMEKNQREDLSLEAIDSLGKIGLVGSGDALLDLLHSGQSPRVQAALALAVRDMGHADLAFSLCAKATQLRSVAVSAAAAEAILRAYPDPEHAMPPGAFVLFREQVKTCWEDKDPWALRFRLTEGFEKLYCQEPANVDEMIALVQGALSDKRIHGLWSLEQQNRAASIVKELGRRQAERRVRR